MTRCCENAFFRKFEKMTSSVVTQNLTFNPALPKVNNNLNLKISTLSYLDFGTYYERKSTSFRIWSHRN